jgi:hypothetical protein
MIFLLITLVLVLIVTIYTKLKQKKSNSFPKEYLITLRNKPKSANY